MTSSNRWSTVATSEACHSAGADLLRIEAPPKPAPVVVSPSPTFLVVAALGDAAALEDTAEGDTRFAWSRVSDDAHVYRLAALQCLLDDVDPAAPLEGAPPIENPITGALVTLTENDRTLERFEISLDGELFAATDDVLDGIQPPAFVFRCPPAFVAKLAALPAGALDGLAERWAAPASDALRDLECIVAVAKSARASDREMFVWSAL